jgi:hypothetical protein
MTANSLDIGEPAAWNHRTPETDQDQPWPESSDSQYDEACEESFISINLTIKPRCKLASLPLYSLSSQSIQSIKNSPRVFPVLQSSNLLQRFRSFMLYCILRISSSMMYHCVAWNFSFSHLENWVAPTSASCSRLIRSQMSSWAGVGGSRLLHRFSQLWSLFWLVSSLSQGSMSSNRPWFKDGLVRA